MRLPIQKRVQLIAIIRYDGRWKWLGRRYKGYRIQRHRRQWIGVISIGHLQSLPQIRKTDPILVLYSAKSSNFRT